MGIWIDSLAIGLGILLGLIHPPNDLAVQARLLRSGTTASLTTEVAGAVTDEVGRFLLSGHPLTLNRVADWAGDSRRDAHTLVYDLWARRFRLTGDGEERTFADAAPAFDAWRTLPALAWGTREEVAPRLGHPLHVQVSLTTQDAEFPRPEALWGYRRPELTLVYRTWTEIPR